MIIVYDTETSGLPGKRMHYTDKDWPRLVQLAAMVMDEDGTERACFHAIIKPDGFTIGKDTSDIHGITQELATRVGLPVRVAIAAFIQLRSLAASAVAHNEEFDYKMVESEIHRLGINTTKPWPKRQCTAQSAGVAELVGIPPTDKMKKWAFTAGKNKTPNLQELHAFLFGHGFEGAHDAMVDVRACGKCWVDLRRRLVL